MVSAAVAAGVQFRFAGADLVVRGAGQLVPDDAGLLREHISEVREHLAETTPDPGMLLEQLGVVVEVILGLTARLPVLVAMLAEARPDSVEAVSDPSDNAVERFLKWEKD